MAKLTGMVLLLTGAAGIALAGAAVPEINPASGISALVVLGGVLLVVRARQKNQKK